MQELVHIRFGRKHNRVDTDVKENPCGYNDASRIDCMLVTCAALFAASKQMHIPLLAIPYCCVIQSQPLVHKSSCCMA